MLRMPKFSGFNEIRTHVPFVNPKSRGKEQNKLASQHETQLALSDSPEAKRSSLQTNKDVFFSLSRLRKADRKVPLAKKHCSPLAPLDNTCGTPDISPRDLVILGAIDADVQPDAEQRKSGQSHHDEALAKLAGNVTPDKSRQSHHDKALAELTGDITPDSSSLSVANNLQNEIIILDYSVKKTERKNTQVKLKCPPFTFPDDQTSAANTAADPACASDGFSAIKETHETIKTDNDWLLLASQALKPNGERLVLFNALDKIKCLAQKDREHFIYVCQSEVLKMLTSNDYEFINNLVESMQALQFSFKLIMNHQPIAGFTQQSVHNKVVLSNLMDQKILPAWESLAENIRNQPKTYKLAGLEAFRKLSEDYKQYAYGKTLYSGAQTALVLTRSRSRQLQVLKYIFSVWTTPQTEQSLDLISYYEERHDFKEEAPECLIYDTFQDSINLTEEIKQRTVKTFNALIQQARAAYFEKNQLAVDGLAQSALQIALGLPIDIAKLEASTKVALKCVIPYLHNAWDTYFKSTHMASSGKQDFASLRAAFQAYRNDEKEQSDKILRDILTNSAEQLDTAKLYEALCDQGKYEPLAPAVLEKVFRTLCKNGDADLNFLTWAHISYQLGCPPKVLSVLKKVKNPTSDDAMKLVFFFYRNIVNKQGDLSVNRLSAAMCMHYLRIQWNDEFVDNVKHFFKNDDEQSKILDELNNWIVPEWENLQSKGYHTKTSPKARSAASQQTFKAWNAKRTVANSPLGSTPLHKRRQGVLLYDTL